jgi:hypothetical protein
MAKFEEEEVKHRARKFASSLGVSKLSEERP